MSDSLPPESNGPPDGAQPVQPPIASAVPAYRSPPPPAPNPAGLAIAYATAGFFLYVVTVGVGIWLANHFEPGNVLMGGFATLFLEFIALTTLAYNGMKAPLIGFLIAVGITPLIVCGLCARIF